jgi:hypothetical protein
LVVALVQILIRFGMELWHCVLVCYWRQTYGKGLRGRE